MIRSVLDTLVIFSCYQDILRVRVSRLPAEYQIYCVAKKKVVKSKRPNHNSLEKNNIISIKIFCRDIYQVYTTHIVQRIRIVQCPHSAAVIPARLQPRSSHVVL